MMTRHTFVHAVAVWTLSSAAVLSAETALPDPFGAPPKWQPPTAEAVQTEVFAWLDGAVSDETRRQELKARWKFDSEPTGETLLDALAQTAAAVYPQAAQIVAQTSAPRTGVALPDTAWLTTDAAPLLVRHNLRLWVARWMLHEGLYDELLDQLAGLEPSDVVDPAALLFCRSIAYQRLARKKEGLQAVEQLLVQKDALPRRYQTLAELVQADLRGMKPESLDHISRWMEDVRRRLDLGRAGKKVRKIEDDVIAALDKMIEELEQQQQQQQSSSSGGGGGQSRGSRQSSSPAPDSQIMGGSGPGNVDKKDIGARSGWGALPPKERERALQQLSKEFPSHYRDVIEQYFRKRASVQPDRPAP